MYVRILVAAVDALVERQMEKTARRYPAAENLTTIPAGRVLVFVESRGAAAGVGRANHCTSTGGPHWASRAEMAKMADAALVRSLTPFASEDGR